MNFHVDPSMLGAKLYNTKTHEQRKILALWMEDPADKAHRPTLVAFTSGMDEKHSYSDLKKINLPDMEGEWNILL